MNETEMPLSVELAELAGRMSPLLLSLESVNSAVEVLTTLAQQTIAAATGAGISLIDDAGHRTSKAATSDLVLEADDLQYRLDEGPCLTSWAEGRPVRIDDIAHDPRWRRWSEAVQPLDLQSSLSVPLMAGGRKLGAVKVYSELPAAFDERATELLEGFAATAALLLGNVESVDNARMLSEDLRQAMRARDTVQLAKGVVMQRDGVSEDAAFQVLVGQARVTSRELSQVADQIVGAAEQSR
ncbi:MAG TPA: GAF and ANTAR domain-containing protein [Propionibacteriaceae bacterium]